MRDTVTLKELLAIAVRRGKRMLVLCVVFALILGITQAYRQIQASELEENTPEQIEMRYKEALEQYTTEKATLETQLDMLERKLESQQTYDESSLRLKLDPYDMYITSITIAITDVPTEALQAQTILVGTDPEFRVSKIQNQYLVYWDCSDLKTALVGQPYEDATDQFLREVVTLSSKDGGLLKLQAYGESAASVEALADAALAFLESSCPTISDASYEHSLMILSKTTKASVYGELASEQENHLIQIQENENRIEELKLQLFELVEPVPAQGYTISSMAVSTIKWMILGAVLGAIVGLAWALIAYLFSNRVETSRQMESSLNIPFLGVVRKKQDCWNVWADRMLGERIWKDQQQALDYLDGNVAAYASDCHSVALLSSLSVAENDPAIETVKKVFQTQGISVDFVGNMQKNPQAAGTVKKSDCVVYVEQCGISCWDAVAESAALAKRLETQAAGFILI